MEVTRFDKNSLGDYKSPGGDDLPHNFQLALVSTTSQEAFLIGVIRRAMHDAGNRMKITVIGDSNDTEALTFQFVEEK